MIFSLFWEGAFIRGGAFILKSEILGGRLFEGAFIRGNTVQLKSYCWLEHSVCNRRVASLSPIIGKLY